MVNRALHVVRIGRAQETPEDEGRIQTIPDQIYIPHQIQ